MKTPGSMFFDTSSAAGVALAIKHILVLDVIVVGLTIAFVVLPRLRKAAPGPGETPSDRFLQAHKSLNRLSLTSTIFGIVIIVCVTFLW